MHAEQCLHLVSGVKSGYTLGMDAARHLPLMTVEDYLAEELVSELKHEYLDGVVYAMSGARNRHNKIAMNVSGALWTRLRGRRCQPYNSDTKIRIRLTNHVRFYYPDVSIICRPNPENESFQDDPVVIVEVLSDSTRRVDEGEKKDAYLSIPSLAIYLLVEQDAQTILAFRRTEQGFVREVYTEGAVPLPEIGTELPMAEVYEGLE